MIGKPDVAIIGAGIVGLFAALFFKQNRPGMRVSVFERSAFGAGATTRNAGFACFGSASELLDDLHKQSESEVFSLVEKRWHGLRLLRQMLGDAAIGFEPCGGVELFNENDREIAKTCLDFLPRANSLLADVIGPEAFRPLRENFGFAGVETTISSPFEGKINTGKMYRTLLQHARNAGVDVHFGIAISSIEQRPDSSVLLTPNGTIHARKVAVCTNGFARHLLPDLDVQPGRNLVMVTQPLKDLPGQAFHYDQGYVYFREIDGRLLIGGARNADLQNEFTEAFDTNENIKNKLIEIVRHVLFPEHDIRIDYIWSGIMGLGESKTPLVGKTHEGLHYAVRMGGMGVALGSFTGRELAEGLLMEEL